MLGDISHQEDSFQHSPPERTPGLTKNQSRIINLLDQILDKAQEDDNKAKLESAINKHKLLPGVSFTLFFGKVLKEELLKEFGGGKMS